MKNSRLLATARALFVTGLVGAATPALAGETLTLKLDYMADVAGVVRGGAAHKARVLDNLKLSADVDLEKALGWSGATFHVSALNNSGATPNDDAGTLQGVDNIEVSQQRARLFEAFVEQSFGGGKGSALVGLYDVNSEFYANESAGLLIAPAFGIGSELAATGPNGPSIFPSTALSARVRWTTESGGYVQGAVINAHAGVPGDPGGADLSFGDGVLTLGEAGWTGAGKLAVGGWAYSKRQDDWRDVTAAGDPVQRRAYGAYALAERRIKGGEDEPGRITAFARVGISDGLTSPFRGGWQAGVLIEQPVAARPASQASFGINQAFLSRRERANGWDAGLDTSRTETALEATYADTFGPITLQPDLQYVIRPAGNRDSRNALVATLRVKVGF